VDAHPERGGGDEAGGEEHDGLELEDEADELRLVATVHQQKEQQEGADLVGEE
jgi:hypothetical protein